MSDVITKYKSAVEQRMDELLNCYDCDYEVLKAMRYSVGIGGKRIRPCILMEFSSMFGADYGDALLFASALEFIHTYSLIHDDLPCMDNDDFRRGKPSCHKEFGEATALLTGDALLTYAFTVASKCTKTPHDRVIRAIEVLSCNAGFSGMIGGQELDLKAEKIAPDFKMLVKIYELKTSRLLQSAAQIGCILGGADERFISKAGEYGRNLGIAFQIIDDILDVTAEEDKLGKPIGSDEKNGKVTAVTLFGIEKAKKLSKEYTQKALSALNEFPHNDAIVNLTEDLLKRNY